MENELVVKPEIALATLQTANPGEVIDRAKDIAKLLVPIVEQQKLFILISGKKHVYVEGWTTMLAMLKIFPHVEFVRRIEREDEIAYEARVLLKTLEGQVVGSGEHLCSNKEPNKRGWSEFAIKSMAQTRAVGKASRLSFSWVMSLAGYNPTPAEEMDHETKTFLPPEDTGEVSTKTMVAEIKDWIGSLCGGDQTKMDAMLKEFTQWKKKNKDTGAYTGEIGWLTFDRLATSEVNWLKRIHGKVNAKYSNQVA